MPLPETTPGGSLTGGPAQRSPGHRHRLVLLALAGGVLLTRLPFLAGAGLGRDPDAWRLWLAGRIAADTGSYVPSRPPGYPALELVATALQGAPWEVFAALTTAATAVAVVAFAALARDLGVRWWPVVGAGLALTHVVLVSSTAFMDYAWALAALGCALLAARRCRPVLAGALLGVAVACRPSTAAAAVALLVVAVLVPWWTWRRLLLLGAAAAAVVLAFFAVPLATYGPDLLSAAPEPFRLERTVQHLGAGVAGLPGAVGLAVVTGAAAFRWLRGGQRFPDGERRAWLIALTAAVTTQLGAYLLLPVDAAYLIPAVAMVWVLTGMLLRRPELGVLAAAAMAGSLVPGLGVPSAAEVAADRRATLSGTTAMVEAIERLPAGSLVVVRGRLPQLLALSGAQVTPGLDPAGTAARVTLEGGQVVTYAYRPADRANPRVYRLPDVAGAPEHLPVLPL